MATMQDVAKHARVSLSTVSYVLSGARSVSEETKKRVHQAMETLGYSPHAVARGLASKKTRILALVFSPPERGIGLTEVDFVTKAAEAARLANYHLVLWTIEPNNVVEFGKLLRQNLIDGVILMEVLMQDPRLPLLEDLRIPCTLIGRNEQPDHIPYADIDTEATVLGALDYLKQLGHRHIAFINQSRAIFESGYGPAVRAHNALGYCDSSLGIREYFCQADPQEAWQICNSFLQDCPQGTACIVMNDRIIPGVLKSLREHRLAIPQDFSLISVLSSSRVAEMFDPALTTWSVPSGALAAASVRQLISLIERHSRETNTILPCQQEIRESSGPRRADCP